MFKNLIFIFIGGGLGSSLRYIISKYLNNTNYLIPYGTLTVNILGSLILGLVLGWAIKHENLNNGMVVFLSVGLCGGFTTFSSFAFENLSLLKSGDYVQFLIYTFGSVLLGLLAVFSGTLLAKFI
tara:strand:+ start:1053 stop:1427 length:375 start_codon:yes stop_codon:yes gene_type:complete